MSITNIVNSREIEDAVLSVSDYLESQVDCGPSWSDLTEGDLWVELVSCILGSRTPHETAKACTDHLAQNGFLDVSTLTENPERSENQLAQELSRAIYPPFRGTRGRKYRYPKSKSHYIVKSAIRIYKDDDTELRMILVRNQKGSEARSILRERATGIGFKQASLFLRNVSHSDDLAILDTHVVAYMQLVNLIYDGVRESDLSKRSRYEYLEGILQDYADSYGLPLSIIDFAIWIVVRLVKREFVIWQL